MNILNRGYWVTTLLSVVGLAITTAVMMQTNGGTGNGGLPTWVYFFFAGIVGLATSVAFVYITQYYTAGSFRPVREIAEASKTGPATNIISGTAVGFETTAVTAITISIALFASHWLGDQANLLSADGRNVGGIFGTAVATMGMLMTTAYILAMDTFGPITDNAGGIAEFSRAEAGAREITDRLDAVGNTTKALTKGYAIASASLAAFLLFSAYIDKINLIQGRRLEAGVPGVELLNSVNLANVNVFIAALIAGMLVYFFSSLAIRAVGTTAQSIIVEVRRQFREMPGIMDYTQRPDYARVVDITTKAALREMIAPGVVAVATPILIGLLLGFEAVAGMLMVGTIAGVLLATVLNNGGGAWDNAKKYIEAGHLKDDQGNVLGKGSPAHAAAVVGDTVGDPFKDTAGPSLHVLVKLLATISLVLAPLFIRYAIERAVSRGAPARRRPQGVTMDTIVQALIMGIVQGLTEFLPISSSGHLIIVPYLFGWIDSFITSLAFSVMLHMGTLVALLVYFRRDWLVLVPAGFATLRDRSFRADPDRKSGLLIAITTIPAIIVGPILNDTLEATVRSAGLVADDAPDRRGDPVAGRPTGGQGPRPRPADVPAARSGSDWPRRSRSFPGSAAPGSASRPGCSRASTARRRRASAS